MVGYLLPIFKDNFDQGPLDKSIFIIQQLFDVVLTEPDLRKIQFFKLFKEFKRRCWCSFFSKTSLGSRLNFIMKPKVEI